MRLDMAPGLLRDPQVRHRLLPWLLWAATFYLIVWFISSGRFNQLAMLVTLAYVGMALWRWPMVGVALLIVGMAGQREAIYYLDFLPSYQAPFIGTIYATDVILAFTSLASLYSLARRGEKPLFLVPLILLFSIALVVNVNGMLVGDVTPKSFLSGFRNHLMGYTIYFAAVGVVDSRRKIHGLVVVMAIMVIYGASTQFAQLTGLIPPTNRLTDVVGRPVVYTRAGVGWLVVLVALLCMAQVAEGHKVSTFLPLSIVTIASSLLMLVRQVMIMVMVGLLSLFFPGTEGRARRWLSVSLTVIILFILFTGVSPFMRRALGDTVVSTIIDRGSMITHGTADPNVSGRLVIIKEQIHIWLSAPNVLLGYGFTPTRYYSLLSGDTGLWNGLVLLGPLGVVAICILWFAVVRASYRLYQTLAPSAERGYVLGAFSFWMAVLPVYFVGLDFFSNPTIEIPLVMLFIDRIAAFARQGLIPVRQNLS